MKKLIIWDFDGVLADSEKIWVQNWIDVLRERKGMILTPDEVEYYLRGIAQKTKIERLERDFNGLKIDDDFLDDIYALSNEAIEKELVATDGIEEILQDKRYLQCIATGATTLKNNLKIKKLNFDKYFDEHNMFTADMVKKGKPDPEMFLLAAQMMGVMPQDCVVVEDSVAGFQAAKAANMAVIAYIGGEFNNNEAYRHICKNENVDGIAANVQELKLLLEKI